LLEVIIQIPESAQDVNLLRSICGVVVLVNNLYEEITDHEDVHLATVLDAAAEGYALSVQIADLLTK